MRIHLKTSANTTPVPFDYRQKLVGTIHKWIGNNSIHDTISLYSFSWLNGGRKVENALQFSQGATMFISFYDESIIKVIIRTILEDPEMFCGMFVTDITIGAEPQFSERDLYYCASQKKKKRRCLFFMERTQTDIVHAAFLERHKLRHHVNDVGGVHDSGYGRFVYHFISVPVSFCWPASVLRHVLRHSHHGHWPCGDKCMSCLASR